MSGATEIWALLSGLGLRATLVDFEGNKGEPAGIALVKWLRAYFHNDDSGAACKAVEEEEVGALSPERSISAGDAGEIPAKRDVAAIRSSVGFGSIGQPTALDRESDGFVQGGTSSSSSIFDTPTAGGSGDSGAVAADLAQHWASAWRAGKARCLPPVFLQHTPHSRTVVGMVRKGDGEFMVVLDPAHSLTISDSSSAAALKVCMVCVMCRWVCVCFGWMGGRSLSSAFGTRND